MQANLAALFQGRKEAAKAAPPVRPVGRPKMTPRVLEGDELLKAEMQALKKKRPSSFVKS